MQHSLLSMTLHDPARGAAQFVDIGSAHTKCQQIILVSHDERQSVLQRHGVKF
jgi:hypothetical protein